MSGPAQGAVILAPVGAALDALVARDAEAVGVLADAHASGRVDAVLIGLPEGRRRTDPAALAVVLSRAVPGLGVIATAARTDDHPFNLARRTLGLDHLSGARGGVLFAAGDEAEPERIRVVRELWNSYPVSSIVGDRENGVFAVLDDVRDIAHAGEHYRVAGALNSPSSRQGEPVSLLLAGGADAEAAGLVDVVVVPEDAEAPAIPDGAVLYRLVDAASPTIGASADTDPSPTAGIVLRSADLADVLALDIRPDRPAGGTLRATLGLPERSLDLSDRPLTFEGAR